MVLRYFFLLALASVSLTSLSSQETATRVSDFNFGGTGKNILTSVNAIDNRLYGNLYQFFGDDAAGLLSELNTTTGAPTPLVDPDQTDWFGGETFQNQASVFKAGGMVFGLQRDISRGNNLYRLDGDQPELLLSTSEMLYTQPVVLGDSMYFITGTLPLRQDAEDSGEILAELWRTDGTAAGTQLVTPLLSFASADYVSIVPGTDRLLIGINDDFEQIFYVYEPDGEGLGLLGEGFGQFIIPAPGNRTLFQPIAYNNGRFYVYGAAEFTDEAAVLYAIEETTYAIEEIPLPEIAGSPEPINTYNHIEFLNFADSLYLFASRTRGNFGNDLFRIGGPAGRTLTPLSTEIPDNRANAEDYANAAIVADTLYYVSRGSGDSLFVLAYEALSETTSVLTGFASNGGTSFLSANDRFVYVTLIDAERLIRFDKRSGGLTDVAFQESFYASSFAGNQNFNPVAVTDAGAFLVNSGNKVGLVVLPTDGDTLRSVGDFITLNQRSNPIIYGTDAAANEIALFTGDRQRYLADTDEFEPISFEPGLGVSIRRFLVVNGESVYEGRDTMFNRRAIRLVDGELQALPLAYSGDFDPDEYSFTLRGLISDNQAILRFIPGTGAQSSLLLASVVGDSLQLTSFMPAGFEELSFLDYFDSEYFIVDFQMNEDKIVVVYNYQGEEQYRFGTNLNGEIRNVSATGAFVEIANEFTLEPTMLFYPAGGEGVKTMPFVAATNAYFNNDFYNVNGRLLFTGDTPGLGREWLVADPGAENVVVLKDINPGRGFSRLRTNALLVTETGMYFSATDEEHGNELWYTDGTSEGTVMLPEVNPGPASANPGNFTLIDSTVFFSANGPAGYELYRMHLRDNTPELIIDLNAGEGDSHPNSFYRVGQNFYFLAREASGETYELFRIDYALVPTDAEPTVTAAHIYPNPVGDRPLTIEAPSGEQLQRLELFATDGRLLREINATGERANMDLSNLPAGTYWLRTWYASGRFSINIVQRTK